MRENAVTRRPTDWAVHGRVTSRAVACSFVVLVAAGFSLSAPANAETLTGSGEAGASPAVEATQTTQQKASAEPTRPERGIRLATVDWRDLWHGDGVALRPGTTVRAEADFKALRARFADTAFDLVALQNVGSPRAVRRIFPANKYLVVFSRELAARRERNRAVLSTPAARRGYSAIAIARQSGLRVLRRAHLLDLANPLGARDIARADGQAGVAVLLKRNKQRLWLASARLLATCGEKDARAVGAQPTTKDDACPALAAQLRALNAWKSVQAARGIDVVLAVSMPTATTRGRTRRGATASTTSTSSDAGAASDEAFRDTLRAGVKLLTASDPSRVALAWRKARAVEERRRGRAGWRSGSSYGGLYGLPVGRVFEKRVREKPQLKGPSRRAGEPFVDLREKPTRSLDQMVVSALRDLAGGGTERKAPADGTADALAGAPVGAPAGRTAAGSTEEKATTMPLVNNAIAALGRIGDAGRGAETVSTKAPVPGTARRQDTASDDGPAGTPFVRLAPNTPACGSTAHPEPAFFVTRQLAEKAETNAAESASDAPVGRRFCGAQLDLVGTRASGG
ncbi:MAG: hypothetical protein AAFQ42_01170 [Pseudomonadota bacterium]